MVDHMPAPVSSQAVTAKIRSYCAIFGRPDEIMSDNGGHYTGESFKNFIRSWNIKHVTSSPHYARSNGFIERHVKHIKPIIRKAKQSKDDIQLALLNVRATPLDANMPSPAEIMFGRAVNTLLPHRSEPAPTEQRQWLHEKQQNMKTYHDKSARKSDLSQMFTGQEVRILDKTNKTWCPATVIRKCDEPRSYIVQTPNGTTLRRNRSHLREMSTIPRRLDFNDQTPQPIVHTPQPLSHQQHDQPSSTLPSTPQRRVHHSPTQQPELPRATSPRDQRITRSGRVVKIPSRYMDKQ